ncbi:MAG: hypothetical protein US50_C0003G0017 [Candidatus Nomurabacteria bacterium GW2011_GWB1_37_5]|uniref:Transposase IS200-like domain-containing protein n=1 Tax=Candidatus Nomurabacteria bacterium GW2011_GWB1_37_5 TaxID=1618742 RepID=A0A0G0H128_9BACT|nr:MAG: hypothetical protein US50_C0003G0017 [Candidatus Nomurabacteria bacterium GW2011_GWB1_37_5]
MRKTPFINDNFYHIYNRGTDKRNIFSDQFDIERFIESMIEFNTLKPIKSLYLLSFNENKKNKNPEDNLVEIVAYCLNPNHFHLILYQKKEGGISEFMRRLGTGYTQFFNEKNKRNGVLFQGKFKSIHINSDNYLLHLSAYVNLNFKIHKLDQLSNPIAKLVRSSWDEYVGHNKLKDNICWKEFVLNKFKNIKEYKDFALKSTIKIINKRDISKELELESLEFEKRRKLK